jgi:putative nucleotidyltransferase with HDIG domain
VCFGQGVAGWVAEHRKPLLLVDDTDPRFARELKRLDVASAISAPIVYGDRIVGVINVNRKKSRAHLFSKDDLDFVVAFVRQLAIALENARLYIDLERTFLGTISALAAAVDAKDPYTYGHANWVTHYAVAIAECLRLEESEVQTIRIASILHDIGKIGIDGAILQKPDDLTTEEREVVRKHPAIGADILASLDFLSETVPLVLFHHEQYGGGGYPSGISGTAIPLGARIIAVADAYDAMTSDRPYRTALTGEEARRELRRNAGRQFDPSVVEAFLGFLEGSEEIHRHAESAVAPVLPFPASPVSDPTRAKA